MSIDKCASSSLRSASSSWAYEKNKSIISWRLSLQVVRLPRWYMNAHDCFEQTTMVAHAQVEELVYDDEVLKPF